MHIICIHILVLTALCIHCVTSQRRKSQEMLEKQITNNQHLDDDIEGSQHHHQIDDYDDPLTSTTSSSSRDSTSSYSHTAHNQRHAPHQDDLVALHPTSNRSEHPYIIDDEFESRSDSEHSRSSLISLILGEINIVLNTPYMIQI